MLLLFCWNGGICLPICGAASGRVCEQHANQACLLPWQGVHFHFSTNQFWVLIMKNRFFFFFFLNKTTRKTTSFVKFWEKKNHKKKLLIFTQFKIRRKKLAPFWFDETFFWLDKVLFSWIKVANVQTQFSPTPLQILTQFQDWELGQSVSLALFHHKIVTTIKNRYNEPNGHPAAWTLSLGLIIVTVNGH
jgi:hypothetical protein